MTQSANPFETANETAALREALWRAQRELGKAKARNAELVEATIRAAKDATLAIGPVPPVPAPKSDRRHARAEVALWHLTDWQGGKETTSYNSAVMRERVERFADRAQELTELTRAHHPVREAVILFGGDMVEGLFNFPTQPFEVDASIFAQYVQASRLMVDVVRRALAIYAKVSVVSEWGNHGRIGSKRSAIPRNDNVDRMCYELARQLLAGEKRLAWDDCPNDIQRVEVGNYRALLIHGDEIGRNGFASRNTIVQAVNRWRSGAHRLNGKPWAFRDVYVGHYHTHAEDPMANGEGAIYWTGSTESDNRYAADSLASSALASQRLHFINPVSGHVTAQYKVRLEED